VICGAIVIVGALYFVTRLADPVSSRSPLELAARIRAAHLGCEETRVVRSSGSFFGAAHDEVDCGSGASRIVLARFSNGHNANSSARKYFCSLPARSSVSRVYVLGSHWIVYPTASSSAPPISRVLHGSVRQGCG
jgi:hypothetical protein